MPSTINADNGVSSGSAGLKSAADSSGVLQLQTNGTTAVTVDTSQNVGIGKTSPQASLDFRQTVNVINTNTTAVASRFYVLTASLTLTLPATPTAGDWVSLQNNSGTLTSVIGRNGSNIMSLAEDMTIDSLNVPVRLTYADATRGWVFN